jgi:hypothetical protein
VSDVCRKDEKETGAARSLDPVLWYNIKTEVKRSALKHGVAPEDSLWVIEHSVQIIRLQQVPPKNLYLGTSRDGRLTEVVAIVEPEKLIVIHAMKMRRKFFKELGCSR